MFQYPDKFNKGLQRFFRLQQALVDRRTSYFNQSQNRLFKNISSPKKLSCRKLLSAGQNRDCHLLLEEFEFVPMMDAVVVSKLVPACRRVLLFRYLVFPFLIVWRGSCSQLSFFCPVLTILVDVYQRHIAINPTNEHNATLIVTPLYIHNPETLANTMNSTELADEQADHKNPRGLGKSSEIWD